MNKKQNNVLKIRKTGTYDHENNTPQQPIARISSLLLRQASCRKQSYGVVHTMPSRRWRDDLIRYAADRISQDGEDAIAQRVIETSDCRLHP